MSTFSFTISSVANILKEKKYNFVHNFNDIKIILSFFFSKFTLLDAEYIDNEI